MDIILSILQVVGIILLVVLAFAIIAILLVLFYPVIYTVSGETQEDIRVKGKFSWLFHLLRGKFIYEDELLYAEVGILWKKIVFSKEFVKEDDEDEIDEEPDAFANAIQEALNSAVSSENEQTDADSSNTSTADENTNTTKSTKRTTSKTTQKRKKKERISDKINRIITLIKEKIKFIKKKFTQIKKLINDEKNKQAVIRLKNELIYLIKILVPYKSKVDGVFSTGSPDTTGQAFGIIACLPVIYKNKWNIVPDFHADKPYFKGTFRGKGRIFLYKMVGILVRIIIDKNCRRLYYILKRLGGQTNAGK